MEKRGLWAASQAEVTNPFPPSKAASPSERRFALSFDLPLKEAGYLCKFAVCNGCA
jgi:hypothetical protein